MIKSCRNYCGAGEPAASAGVQDKRIVKFFLLFVFLMILFISCCLPETTAAQQAEEFPKLDFKRVEQKCLQFQKLANRSKNFRKVVYISSALATASLLTYLGIKFFGKQEKKEDNSKPSQPSSPMPTNLSQKINKALSFGDQCRYYFKKGVSKGFYYGGSAVLVSSFLGIQSSIYSLLKNKFVELWNGQGEEIFLSIVKLLEVNIKQLDLFFHTWDLLDDEDELKENYALFIDCFENLIALVTQSTLDLMSAKPTIQQSILNLRDILCAKIVDFTDELKQLLVKDLKERPDLTDLDSVKISFRKLSGQVGRFVNLYYSALYEV